MPRASSGVVSERVPAETVEGVYLMPKSMVGMIDGTEVGVTVVKLLGCAGGCCGGSYY